VWALYGVSILKPLSTPGRATVLKHVKEIPAGASITFCYPGCDGPRLGEGGMDRQ
jgi:hypothetical protein